MALERLTWDNWNMTYKNEFIELMVLMDANIGNPSVLSMDDIPLGGRRFSEVFNSMLRSLDDLVREAVGHTYLMRLPRQFEAAALSRLAERRLQEWNARTERVMAWNAERRQGATQGQAIALVPEHLSDLDQLGSFDSDDLESLVIFMKYYMHLTGELIAIGRRDFEAARSAMLMNRNGIVNRRTILLFYRFWVEGNYGAMDTTRPTQFHERYNPQHPYYNFLRNTQIVGGRTDDSAESAQSAVTAESSVSESSVPRRRLRNESGTEETGVEQERSTRQPRYELKLRERQAVYGPYDEELTTHGVYCSLCCEVHDLYDPNGPALTRLPCGHMFCVDQINRYCRGKYAERLPMECPLCRRPFFNGGLH